ncbi:uncharacterized protein EV420DRAFT_1478405 [Desarmillaria tabescens]|uniref:Uncharacterized protein n=1 Tax=Armillaria tabescens TaxID=1929756 RepID=A0AA39TJ09_ARMTA|nr:uncharacterized protein EV420DRAFT_1478405 [Desarmillaria tabescens]KAK0460647.1 hypothetical protein EV420DRAFT_1478405 [Desarmillaria tabescens]
MSWRTFDAQTDISVAAVVGRRWPDLHPALPLSPFLPSAVPLRDEVRYGNPSDILCRHRAALACPMTIEVDARVGGMGWVAAECRSYRGNGRDAWVTSSTYNVAVISGSAASGEGLRILGLPDTPKRPKFDMIPSSHDNPQFTLVAPHFRALVSKYQFYIFVHHLNRYDYHMFEVQKALGVWDCKGILSYAPNWGASGKFRPW